MYPLGCVPAQACRCGPSRPSPRPLTRDLGAPWPSPSCLSLAATWGWGAELTPRAPHAKVGSSAWGPSVPRAPPTCCFLLPSLANTHCSRSGCLLLAAPGRAAPGGLRTVCSGERESVREEAGRAGHPHFPEAQNPRKSCENWPCSRLPWHFPGTAFTPRRGCSPSRPGEADSGAATGLLPHPSRALHSTSSGALANRDTFLVTSRLTGERRAAHPCHGRIRGENT